MADKKRPRRPDSTATSNALVKRSSGGLVESTSGGLVARSLARLGSDRGIDVVGVTDTKVESAVPTESLVADQRRARLLITFHGSGGRRPSDVTQRGPSYSYHLSRNETRKLVADLRRVLSG
jgi:hypothetical protein